MSNNITTSIPPDDDLVTRTEADVAIAVSALLDNMCAALKTIIELSEQDFNYSAQLGLDWISLQDQVRSRTASSPPSSYGDKRFDEVAGSLDLIQRQGEAIQQAIQQKWDTLDEPKQKKAIRELRRFQHHHEVTRKLLNQLVAQFNNLPGTSNAVGTQPGVAGVTISPDDQALYDRLNKLLATADLLGDYTTMWTIYERGWLQRYRTPDKLKQAAYAGDAVIHDLYREIEATKVRLKLSGSDLVTIFFESRLFTRVANVPAPYLVAPYWGIDLVWNWLAFGHEVGHHAFVNIGEELEATTVGNSPQLKGISLGDELFVHIAAYLLTLEETTYRHIWYRWVEEIFADLFCLLRFGPVSVRSMQHMFFHLPPNGFSRLLKSPPRHREWLLRADDAEHPIPYLRVNLGLDTLEILIEFLEKQASRPDKLITYLNKERNSLQERWNSFFAGVPEDLYYPSLGFKEDRINQKTMRETGKDILRIMLTTPLYSLLDKSASSQKPRTLMGVFFDRDVVKVQDEFNNLSNMLKDAASPQQFDEARDTFHMVYKAKQSKADPEIRYFLGALQLEFERVTIQERNADQLQLRLKQLRDDTIRLLANQEKLTIEEITFSKDVRSPRPPASRSLGEVDTPKS